MSFEATYKTKIKDVNLEFLEEAISMMIKDLEVNRLKVNKFSIYGNQRFPVRGVCFKDQRAMYPVDLFINKNNALEIRCDTSDQRVYKEYMKRVEEQFYPAVVVSHRTGAPVQYNKETEELTLMVTR